MSAEIGTTHHYEATHLEIAPGLDWDTWSEIWQFVRQNHRSSLFWIGDCLLAAESQFPNDQWAQAVDGHAVDLYRGAMWVCRKIEPARRREAVSFSAHKEIAALEPREQDRWLKLIEEGDWSIKRLQEERAAEKARLNGGGYPSNQPPPNGHDEPGVPHGTNDSNIDIKSEPRRNADADDTEGEIAVLRSLIDDVKGYADININATIADGLNGSRFEGWLLDITSTEKGWAVRLQREGQKQAIAINPNFTAAVVEAILAARISDLSA